METKYYPLTSFVNELLENTLIKKEKVIVVKYERREVKIEDRFQDNNMIIVTEFISENPLTKGFIKNITELYRPHRIIIEYNDTKAISEFLNTKILIKEFNNTKYY